MEYLSVFGNEIVKNAPNLVGFVFPLFIEFANKDVKNEQLRFLMEVIVCFVFAVVLNWNQIALGTPDKAVAVAGMLFLESELLFKLYFKDSWLRGKIQSIGTPEAEGAVSIKSGVDTTQ